MLYTCSRSFKTVYLFLLGKAKWNFPGKSSNYSLSSLQYQLYFNIIWRVWFGSKLGFNFTWSFFYHENFYVIYQVPISQAQEMYWSSRIDLQNRNVMVTCNKWDFLKTSYTYLQDELAMHNARFLFLAFSL